MEEKKNTIRELPASERPYEKCMALGPAALSDAELLAVILRTGTKGQGALQTARHVLSLNPSVDGLLGLHHLNVREFQSIPGIGKVKAIQLSCIGELTKRMSRKSIDREKAFVSPGAVAAYFMEEMRHKEKEELRVVLLDTKSRFLHDLVISMGTVNSSLVSPREIFLEALKYQAVSIILLHNHPSGDPDPSKEDILVTRRVYEAGRLLGISLADHIIIGDNCFISLKERGIL
ncbi:DNA repair protein RadC [Lacrimispora sp. NSJ-141]|uniref:DNA repair protein RadC n=1 Tax=Lientehia hominis TaxID=2897778 RepID=A0AAP2RGM3_9FIRM|nr:DNA repair protein RadC [Lientehia hominis]MCD2491044.1 DNA repair protein RadC [Lientehia hominis]